MYRPIQIIVLALILVSTCTLDMYAEDRTVVEMKERTHKHRDEVPVVNYDEDNETLTVSFEEMTYQGLVTITVTNVLDGTSQTCVHSTTEEAMECAMSNTPGSYQILIVTDDGTEYEGYLTI